MSGWRNSCTDLRGLSTFFPATLLARFAEDFAKQLIRRSSISETFIVSIKVIRSIAALDFFRML